MRIALVAGEASGDILGAALIAALRQRFPEARFYGVAGARMREAGCEAVAPVEALSVMGLAEVLAHLPRLVALRRALQRRFVQDRPDVFIGIDAPDFNLGLARALRQRGIRTVHLVSPTIWAWRRSRAAGVARAVDLLLCLYPFEPPLYEGLPLRALFVGHPLADELHDGVPPADARAALGLERDTPVVALLPGSRNSELRYLAEPFAGAAAWLAAREPTLQFVVPAAGPELRRRIEQAAARHAPAARWRFLDGRSREAMRAADVVLLASGTATLECLLLGRPMVVAYRVAPVTAFLMRGLGLLKIPHVSQPNLLCAEPVVPELLQGEATPERLGQEVHALLLQASLRRRQLDAFASVRERLRQGAAGKAAGAVAELLGR